MIFSCKKIYYFFKLYALSGSGHFNRCNILISELSRKKDRYFYTVEETNFLYEKKKIYNKFKVLKAIKKHSINVYYYLNHII